MTVTTRPIPSTTAAAESPTSRALERSRRDDTASIPSALRSEWIKVSTLRSNVTILALTPVVGVALSWILAAFVKIDPDTDLQFTVGETFIFSTWLTTVLAAIVGTLMFTSETQHGTLPAAVAAQPARWVLVASKAVVGSGLGVAMGALGMIGGLTGTILGRLARGDTSAMASTALWGLVLTALAPIFGLGVGMIVRHSAAAVSILLVWAFVLENIARTLIPVSATRYLPFSVATGILGMSSASDTPESIAAALTSFQNGVVFGGYAFVLLAIGAVLFSRRDMA